ncbi:MAG TPA: hypothetical protein VMV57_06150 [Terracidiphilus sp.]|nr:hypothetical protein [Terracidiphilus sp.]
MKKNVVGAIGIVLAIGVLLLFTGKTHSPAHAMTQLDLALVVVLLGAVAAIRGSLVWLLLSVVGLAELIFIIF